MNKPLWRAENKEEFSHENLLQLEVLLLPNEEDVETELEHMVWVVYLIHDELLRQISDVAANETTNHEYHRDIESNYPAGMKEMIILRGKQS